MRLLRKIATFFMFMVLLLGVIFFVFAGGMHFFTDEEWCQEFTSCEDASCCVESQKYRRVFGIW